MIHSSIEKYAHKDYHFISFETESGTLKKRKTLYVSIRKAGFSFFSPFHLGMKDMKFEVEIYEKHGP